MPDELFARLLGLSGAHGRAYLEWGEPSARADIRASLAETLPGFSTQDLRAVASLTEPPRPGEWSVSISHARGFGGWMALARPAQIGWDIEAVARLKPHILERISTPQELIETPERAFLWCAKEAFFKALEDEQPLTIPEITITEWAAAGDGAWTYRALGPRNGRGWVVKSEEWILSACLVE